jgi:transcriptional regulator with XRE-family HTH domain
MIDNKVVGQAISRMRQDAGMTQQALAACLNVSHQAVSKWENGTALPDVLTLLEISKLFGITMEQLLSGEIPSRYEKETPIREQPIELKLDLNPLSEQVQKAMDEADRAMDEADKAAEESRKSAGDAPAGEPAPEAGDPTADAETGDGEDIDIDIDKIIKMAPFMSREGLDDMVLRYKGKCDARQLSRLAPFVSSETLEKLIVNSDNEINWDTLRRLAPFLKREAVDALTMAVAKGEKYFRPAAKAAEKSAKDLGRAVSHGLDKVFRHLSDLGDQIDGAFKSSSKTSHDETSERSVSSARTRIFQRALNEEKFDWIAEHIDQLKDDALRERIVQRARELGMNDWISENLNDYFDQELMDGAILSGNWEYITEHLDAIDEDTCDLVVSSAISQGRWDWLAENIDELSLTDENVLAIINGAIFQEKWDWLTENTDELNANDDATEILVNAAIGRSKWDWLIENMDELDLDDRAGEIAKKAYGIGRRDVALELVDEYSDSFDLNDLVLMAMDKADNDFVQEVMEHCSDAASDICLKLAREGRLNDAVSIAEHANTECLAELLEIATDAGDWDVINKINDLI